MDHFESGVCPDRHTLNDVYDHMMASIDQADGDLRRRMLAELKAFRVLNLRFGLLKFELDEKQIRV